MKRSKLMGTKFAWNAAWLIAAALALTCCASKGARAQEDRKCDPRSEPSLYTIGYAHLDTQWRWTFQDSIYMYIGNTMYDNFKLFEKYPDYRFNFTGSKRYMMMDEYYPEDFKKVKDYVEKGNWYISGSSVDENDANVPSTESLLRNIMYGNLYFKEEFGKVSEDYMLPDCFGFPASMPSVLAHAGMKGFSTQKLSWGSANGIPFNVGVWEGPDGRSVVGALNPGSYVARLRGDLTHDEDWLKRAQELGELTGFSADFKYFGTGDQGGAPDDESAMWMQKSVEGDGPLCVDAAQSDDIFQDVNQSEMEKMKHYKGDLLLIEHSAGSLTSQAYVKRWNRKNELLADDAERASLIADWLGAIPYPTAKLRGIWEMILGGQMHDILPGTSVPKAYEYSWNDAVMALNQSAGIIESAAGAASLALNTKAEGKPLIVFNPLSIEREDVVQAKVKFEEGLPKAVRVFGPSGEEVPAQIVGGEGDEFEIVFPARVPSLGYAVFDVRGADAPGPFENGLKATESGVENGRFRVEIDGNGDVSSIYDKVAGREALSAPARLDLMEDTPRDWPAWNIDWADWQNPARAVVKGPVKARVVENGPVRAAVEIEREQEGSTFIQKISLAAGEAGDRVDFDISIDWRTPETNLKAAFPLAVSNKNASYNLGLGVIERETNHPRKYEVPSHQWFDLTAEDGSYGVSILEDSKFASDKPSENTVRLTLVRTPGCQSFCDQATQDMGKHQIKYAAAPHQGDWRKGGTHWKAMRLNQPPIAFTVGKHDGALGKSFSFLQVNTTQVSARAAKKAEESDEIIVRLAELNGEAAAGVKVSFAGPVISAREVDGQERPLGEAKIEGGALAVDMDPFMMRAFAVKIGKPEKTVARAVSAPAALDYNVAVATHDREKVESAFDGGANAYSADMLPDALTVDGIDFKLSRGGAGVKNAIACEGQEVPLPAGDFDRVYILAAAAGGDVEGVFEAGGKKTTLAVQEWTGYVGQWDNRIWRNDREIYGLKPAHTKRDEIAWFASHYHNSSGKNMAYNYSYIFKYAIDLPKGATVLKLPDESSIRIFAVTAVKNPTDGAAPAQLLYDDFDRPEDPPKFSPAEGKYNDSVFVDIQTPWYATYDELRYTTDGSEPTKNSPVYRGPILVTDRTVIKASAFKNDGTAGLIQLGQFDIDDVTPPSVGRVNAFDLAPKAIVKLTEPVDKATAENVGNYAIEPGIKVESAVLDADRTTVSLGLSDVPSVKEEYTLTVKGLRDLSKRQNIIKEPVKFGFRIIGPAFSVKFRTKDINYSLGLPGVSKDYDIHGDPKAVKGLFGLALRLKGGGECIDIHNRHELNPEESITLAAWMRPFDWEGNRRILQKGENDDQYRLLAEQGRLVFDLAGVGKLDADLPPAQEWHHVAATYDGWRMRLYVDGAIVAERDAAGTISISNGPLRIGAKNLNSVEGDFFKGDIDKVMVWEQALPPDQVAGLAAK